MNVAPAISVIIAVYNTEKFLGACLESLLAQTFTDFEVVAVNNGSTDNSAEILKNYVPKFEGRLKIFHIEKNSGGPSPAWNLAISQARGKYVCIVDSDDLITDNALEIRYNYAETFGADVVHNDLCLIFGKDSENPFPEWNSLQLNRGQDEVVTEPTFETENLAERVERFCMHKISWMGWAYLVRREVLLENDITFPLSRTSQDLTWALQIFCSAQKFLHIPIPTYIFRKNSNSLTRKKRNPKEKIEFWMDTNAKVLKFLIAWLEGKKFFQENPKYKWQLVEHLDKINSRGGFDAIQELPITEMYEIASEKFAETFQESSSLMAYLFIKNSVLNFDNIFFEGRIAELEKQIQGG